MKHKSNNYKHLTKAGSDALLRAKGERAVEREQRAAELQDALSSEYRRTHGLAVEAEIPAADRAILSAAVSASLEIATTTQRLIVGRVTPKALKSCGFARSELRRCLRALGMVRDSEQREDPNGVTLEDLKKEYEHAAVGAAK